MRITITAIIIWAILLGSLITGVKVMATSPEIQPAIQTEQSADNNVFDRTDYVPQGRSSDLTGSDSNNGMRLDN